jgi:hypothetical protein
MIRFSAWSCTIKRSASAETFSWGNVWLEGVKLNTRVFNFEQTNFPGSRMLNDKGVPCHVQPARRPIRPSFLLK